MAQEIKLRGTTGLSVDAHSASWFLGYPVAWSRTHLKGLDPLQNVWPKIQKTSQWKSEKTWIDRLTHCLKSQQPFGLCACCSQQRLHKPAGSHFCHGMSNNARAFPLPVIKRSPATKLTAMRFGRHPKGKSRPQRCPGLVHCPRPHPYNSAHH